MEPRYQINLRLTEEERPLFEAAKRQFGSYKTAILAGLRALDLREEPETVILLTDDDSTPPGAPSGAPPVGAPAAAPHPEPPAPPAPSTSESGEWWLSLDLAAALLGASEDTVRRWASENGAETRGRGRSLEIEVESLEVPRHVAARLLRVKSSTLASREKTGREPHPLANGLYRIGDLHFTIAEAARHTGVTRGKIRQLLDTEELPEREGEDGEPRVPAIDLLAHAE